MAYPILAPGSTWYKSSTSRSTYTQINIVDSYTPTGSENESWNADVDNSGSIKCYRSGTVLTIAGNGSGKIAMNADSNHAFSLLNCSASTAFSKVTAINNAGLLATSNVTSMNRTFKMTSALKTLDVSNWDTSKVTDMQCMFDRTGLVTIALENWNVSNVTDMKAMFQMCQNLTALDLSKWNVGNVTDMEGMFMGHPSIGITAVTTIGDVSNWDVSSVTDMNRMFYSCNALTSLDVSKWDVSSVTDMCGMFYDCDTLTSLDVSNWDVSSVTDMSHMFEYCRSLASLDVSKWNVSNVTTMKSMFCGDNYGSNPVPIKTLDVSNWDVSNVTDMGWAFYGMPIESLDVSKWNVSKVTSFHHAFAWCTRLVLKGLENWNPSSALTFNAMFHSNRTESYDLSGWDVSKAENFAQMFERNTRIVKIEGLDKWDVSSGKHFGQMFLGCVSLTELDLSSFDTTKVTSTYYDPERAESVSTTMAEMFGQGSLNEDGTVNTYAWNRSLRKIKLGKNFSFNGDGSVAIPAVLPDIDVDNTPGADGNWYDAALVSYSQSGIPNRLAGTYYSSKPLATEAGETRVSIKNGTLVRIAHALRAAGATGSFLPSEFAETITKLSTKS